MSMRRPGADSARLPGGASDYQAHSRAYYEALAPHLYGTGAKDGRWDVESRPGRYRGAGVEGLANLNSLLGALRRLLGGVRRPRGVDFGCGSHYFVDRASREWGWDVAGYDVSAASVALARQRYPASAGRYRRRDLVRAGLPEAAGSQDFVFTNAVIQHFSRPEFARCLLDIVRVLKPGGLLLAVFKTPVDDWAGLDRESGISARTFDAAEGRALIDDPLLRGVLARMAPEARRALPAEVRSGLRLFHLYRPEEVVGAARRMGLALVPRVALDAGRPGPGLIRFRSGRGMPTAAAFLRRRAPIRAPSRCEACDV